MRPPAPGWRASAGACCESGDTVLWLEDFGDALGGTLRNAIGLHNLLGGMRPLEGLRPMPARPGLGSRQLYFVDACRNTPEHFMQFREMHATDVWDIVKRGGDWRSATVFHATVHGEKAYAVVGRQTIFSSALLQCLEGDAGALSEEDEQWGVSSSSLIRSLPLVIEQLNRELDVEQMCRIDGVAGSVARGQASAAARTGASEREPGLQG